MFSKWLEFMIFIKSIYWCWSWVMISNFWIEFRFCLVNGDRQFYFINSLFSWSKITCYLKCLIWIKFFLIWLKINFFWVFFRNINQISYICLGKIFYFVLSWGINSCKSWGKKYFAFILEFNLRGSTCSNKIYFSICARHII